MDQVADSGSWRKGDRLLTCDYSLFPTLVERCSGVDTVCYNQALWPQALHSLKSLGPKGLGSITKCCEKEPTHRESLGDEIWRSREQIRAGEDFLAEIVSVFWANEMIFVFMKKIIRVFGKGFVLLTTLSVYRLEPYLGNSIPQGFQNPRVPQPPYPARGRKPRPRTKIENSLPTFIAVFGSVRYSFLSFSPLNFCLLRFTLEPPKLCPPGRCARWGLGGSPCTSSKRNSL